MLDDKEKFLVDSEFIASKLAELVTETIDGDVLHTEVTVTFGMPAKIKEIVDHIVERTGTSENEILAKMCQANLKEKLADIRKMFNPVQQQQHDFLPPDVPKLDALGDFGEKMKQLEGIMSQFGQMSSQMKNLQKIADALGGTEKDDEQK